MVIRSHSLVSSHPVAVRGLRIILSDVYTASQVTVHDVEPLGWLAGCSVREILCPNWTKGRARWGNSYGKQRPFSKLHLAGVWGMVTRQLKPPRTQLPGLSPQIPN